jgi:hypothetical protein
MPANAEELAAMDAAALVAELRALNIAGDSYEQQARCCLTLRDASPLPTGAAAEEAVRTVVSALSCGVQHAPLQIAGCVALGMLLHAAPSTSVAALAAALAALRTHPDSAHVQTAACFALAHFVGLDDTNRTTAGAAGGVAAVVAAITRHPSDLDVVTRGCFALSGLAQNHPQNASAAVDAGAVTAALAAMRAFPANAKVQLAGVSSLGHILYAAGTLGGTRADSAAADAVLAAMHGLAGDCEVQQQGCAVLLRLFKEDRHADAAWVRRGATAVSVLAAALHAHLQDVGDAHKHGLLFVKTVFAVLTSLMLTTQENKRAAGIGGAIKAVVAAMRVFPAAAELQSHGCNVLGNMCYEVPDNQRLAVSAGALEATISAMRTHALDAHLQRAGCFALNTLVEEGAPRIQTRVGELGGVEVLVAALRTCADGALDSNFANAWGTPMLRLLLQQPINKHKAVAAGSLERLVPHVCVPAGGDVAMFEVAVAVLHQLIVGTGHEARAVLAGALEATGAHTASHAADVEERRVELVQCLQPAARRHDAAPCAVAGCQRCAAARASGVMCALPGCGARCRDGAANKKLLRCGTCLAACYCGPAHQREDWRRHKGACGAPARDAGASGR